MPTAVELPANFRSIAEFSNAVDSSLHSVSSGVQAAQNSGLTQIADSLHSFDAILPPIGSPPQSLQSLSDAGAVASPDHYLSQANEFIGKDAFKSFSNLAPMNEVLQKLMDPNLEQQKSLRSFSDLLSNFNLPGVPPGDAHSSKAADGAGIAHEAKYAPDFKIAHEMKYAQDFKIAHEAKHAPDFKIAHEMKYAQEFKFWNAPLGKVIPGEAGETKVVRFDDPGFTPKISGDQRDIDPGFKLAGFGEADSNIDPGFTPPSLPGDATAEKWVPSDPGFTPKLTGDATAEKWVPSDPGFTPKLTTDPTEQKWLPSDPGFTPNLPTDASADKWVPSDPGFTPKIADGSLRDMDPGFVPGQANTLADDAQRIFDLQNTLQNIVSLNKQISEF